jgi:REP element-mobilizing transposase RayT
MRSSQPYLEGFEGLKTKSFGGSTLKGNPREARPVSTKRPMHLVVRSSLAKGELSLLRRSVAVEKIVRRTALRKGVKIHRFANAGNHLHLIIQPRSRKGYQAFIRAMTGLLARLALKAERGRGKGLRFWDARPFTRILEWGRDFREACGYVLKNFLEAEGFLDFVPRNKPSRTRARTAKTPPRARTSSSLASKKAQGRPLNQARGT